MANTNSKSAKKKSTAKSVSVNVKKTNKPATAKLIEAVNKQPARSSASSTRKTSSKSAQKPAHKTQAKASATAKASNPKRNKAPKAMDVTTGKKPSAQSPVKTAIEKPVAKESSTVKTENKKEPTKDSTKTKTSSPDSRDAKATTSTSRSAKPSFFNLFTKILGGILIASAIFFLGMLVYLNMLPMLYLVIVAVVVAAITAGLGFTLIKGNIKKVGKIPASVIAVIFSCIYLVGGIYIMKASGFLDNLKGEETVSEQYYVIVKNDSPYNDLKSLSGKTIATFDENIEIYQKAIEKLQHDVDAKLETVISVRSMIDGLLNNNYDALFISAIHKGVIEEDDSSFREHTKIIHTIEIKVKVENTVAHPDINVVTEPFSVLISGVDAYGDLSDRGRSDVNMIATVNPITHEVLLTSIPRDYYVQLHGTTGVKDKLTHAGIYGVNMSLQTLEDLLDIDIDYYIKVNFSTLVNLVDTIGGIDVYSDATIKPLHGNGRTIHQGMNHLDGSLALAFARERYSYKEGDRHRVKNQQDVITAIIKKVSTSTVILTKADQILNDLSSSISTNVGKKEISSLVKMQLQDMPTWTTAQYSLNGGDAHDYTYSFGSQQLYVMTPYPETVQTAHDYITGMMQGKTFQELGIQAQ